MSASEVSRSPTSAVVLEAPASRPEVVQADGTGRALVVGGTLLGVATLVANAGNYAVNLLLGRWLTPPAFADATLMVTLWLTMSGVAMALVLVTARFVGVDPYGPATATLLRRLRRLAWLGGLGLALVLAGGSPLWTRVFHAESVWPFVVLAVGLPFHLSLAVGRGTLQGRLDFRWLAASLLTEMGVRVLVSSTAVLLGGGVVGATAGLSAALVASWALVRHRTGTAPGAVPAPLPPTVRAYVRSVAVLLSAQVVLSNVDLLAAKGFLPADQTGAYSAVALIGRGVFFVSWAAATVLFPAVARRHRAGAETGSLLRGGLLAVGGLGLLSALGALVLGDPVLTLVLGPDYGGLAPQLAVYALVSTVFALANLVATHHLSTGRVRESWVMLGGAGLLTVAVLVVHSSMDALIGVQLVVMLALLLAVSLSHRTTAPHGRRRAAKERTPR